MGLAKLYRKAPDYVALPLALLLSAAAAITLAALGGIVLDFLLAKFRRADDLDDAILAFFYVAPAIALLGFVSAFSLLANWHREASWRVPTFALALGAVLLWGWGRDWLGPLTFVPGILAWAGSCMLTHRKSDRHPTHVLKA